MCKLEIQEPNYCKYNNKKKKKRHRLRRTQFFNTLDLSLLHITVFK